MTTWGENLINFETVKHSLKLLGTVLQKCSLMMCLVIYDVDIPLIIKITDECLHHKKSFYSPEKSALKLRGKVKSHSGLNIPHGAAEIASLWLAAWLINLVTCWFADWLDFGLTDCSACTPIIHLCVKDPLSKRPNLIWRTLHMWNSSTATHTSLHYTTGVCSGVCVCACVRLWREDQTQRAN